MSSSVTLNKLYYTCFYLVTTYCSVKIQHQAVSKNYKMETLYVTRRRPYIMDTL
jgi:hypothetical protein